MPDLNFLELQKSRGTSGGSGAKKPGTKRTLFSFREKKKRAVGVNLITSEAQKEVRRTAIRKNVIQLIVSLLLALLLALFAYGGLLFYGLRTTARVTPLRDELTRVEAAITKLERENKKILKFQNKLTEVKSLLDRHPSFLGFFDALEKNTLPIVFYDSLSLSDDGNVSLSAATESYTSLARQLLALEQSKDFLSSVQFSSIAASLDRLGTIIGIKFNISLHLLPSVLEPKQTTDL